MPLIPSTVSHDGQIHGVIVFCTQEEYEKYSMFGKDTMNEYTVSATFLKGYLSERGLTLNDVVDKLSIKAPAGNVGYWAFATTVTIPNLKYLLHEADIDFHTFIDAYCEHLKSL